MKIKKKNSIIMVVLLIVSVVSACVSKDIENEKVVDATPSEKNIESKDTGDELKDNFNATGLPIVNDSITLRVLIGAVPDSPEDLNTIEVLEDAEKATNIKIDWINPGAQGFNEKKSIMLSTGDLPDMIISGTTNSDIATYGGEIFVPLQDLIAEYGPNVTMRMEAQPEYRKQVTAPDGNLYSFPRVSEGPWNSRVTAINKSWLDKLELPMPETIDEFKGILKAFIEEDPNGNKEKDEIGFTTEKGVPNFEHFFNAFGVPYSGDYITVDEGKVSTFADDENFKKAILYLNGMYKDGLIDEETFVQTGEQLHARVNQDPSIVGATYLWDQADVISDPDILSRFEYLPLLKNPEGNDPVSKTMVHGVSHGGVITTACENPEAAVRWADYWYEPMNSMELLEGKIGDRLTEQPDGTFQISATPPEGMTIASWRAQTSLASRGLWWVSYDDYTIGKNIRIPSTDKKVAHLQKYHAPYYKDEYLPGIVYTIDETAIIADIQTNFVSFVETSVTEWIRNGKVEEEWESYVAELDEIGVPKLLETYQDGYDRFVKNK